MDNAADNITRIAFPCSINKLPLFAILEKCYNVAFIQDDNVEQNGYNARIIIAPDAISPGLMNHNCHTYIISKPYGAPIQSSNAKTNICFSNSPLVPKPFWNKSVSSSTKNFFWHIERPEGYEAISTIMGLCVWAINKVGDYFHYVVGMELPHIPQDEPFFKHFDGNRFYEILPLVDFIRRITGIGTYQRPSQPASIIFDDSNIHFPRYGFINFRDIALHATKYNYHVAFASVPLDLFYANKKTVNTFMDHRDRLSLLIHGNNHLSDELGLDYEENEGIALLSQALTRVHAFERKYGLPVSPVMAAPHGTCTEKMLLGMMRCGYEAACISFSQFYSGNLSKAWTTYLGVHSSSIISGLPVLDRFRFSSPNCMNRILLAAYMNRPIILYGHSTDLKDNLDVLQDVAGMINSLGEICWTNLQNIVRSNYLIKREGNTLHIKLLARHVNLKVPLGIQAVYVEKLSSLNGIGLDNNLYSRNGGRIENSPRDNFIPVEGGDELTIVSQIGNPIDKSNCPSVATAAKAICRRIYTESRDHFLPFSKYFLGALKNVVAGKNK